MNKTKSFIILAVAILLGMSIQWVDPFFSILLVFTWGMAFICSVIALLSGIFSKRFRIWYLLGFVPFVSGYLFMTGIRDYRHRKAVDIVGRINMYAKERGRLPDSLIQVTGIRISGLRYSTDTSHKRYHLEYLMDQFNREYYDSKSNRWRKLGWND